MCDPTTLQEFLDEHGIQYFSAGEVTLLRRWGRYVEPPRKLWDNIVPTIILADKIRDAWGGPLTVASGYRPEEYNRLVGGEPESEHKAFRALDISYPTGRGVEFLSVALRVIQGYMDDGFEVGVGVYRTFLHIDVGAARGNRFWTGR